MRCRGTSAHSEQSEAEAPFRMWNCINCLWVFIYRWQLVFANIGTYLALGTNTCISWRETARGRAEEKLTVSGGLILVFGGVGTVSSRRAGAHAEDVPGGWFQTGDDHTGSLGAS